MGLEANLGWREAEARGFRPAFILARKVDPSREGTLFFIAELLAAPNGARWWRHRRDTSPLGQPFTPSYKSEAEAQRTLDELERADALAQAVDLLVQTGVQAAKRSVLDQAYRRATTNEEAISPGALAETYLQFCTWAEETLRLIQREEPRCQPSAFEMESAFFAEKTKTPEAMLQAWREADRRLQRDRERIGMLDKALRILLDGGVSYVFRHRLSRVFDLETTKCDGTPGAQQLTAGYRAVEAAVEEAQNILKGQGIDAAQASSKLENAYFSGCVTPQSLVDHWRSVLEDERLRERKQKERRERREREDELIWAMAPAFAASRGPADPPRRADLKLIGNSAPGGTLACQAPENVLDQIHEALSAEPWLRHLIVHQGEWPNLLSSEDGARWEEKSRSFPVSARSDRSRMAALADAYGPVVDWTDPWHIIRPRLLNLIKNKELDLLHRADVLAALDRAKQAGKELVVFGHVAYQWVDGEWRLREVVRRDRSGRNPGATLWLEGPIISRNYGRIIILPFIRSDGTENNGYTRNSPYEGEAPSRAEPKLILFEVYARNGRDDTWVHSGDIVVPDSEMVAIR